MTDHKIIITIMIMRDECSVIGREDVFEAKLVYNTSQQIF